MPVRALVVDDSGFFRRRVAAMLDDDPRIEVVGTAADGLDALRQVEELRPDVVTMDIEMPVMDGITALRRIMERNPTPVLMLSSLTQQGARATFEALEAGALDYLPKNFRDIADDPDRAASMLRSRVWALGRRGMPGGRAATRSGAAAATAAGPPASPRARPATAPAKRPELVVIGASTGGPVALQRVLVGLPRDYPVPILLVQHMPGSFTGAFARRLDEACAIRVREARDGDVPEPGLALLAPGGRQMELERRRGGLRLRLRDPTPAEHYRPCVDLTMGSVAKALPGHALAVILTGMGADGREGARALKRSGGAVWAQDRESSVIYGMPAAVAEAGLADAVLDLDEIGRRLARL